MTNHSITSIPEPEDVFLLRIAAILSPEITEMAKKQRETKEIKIEIWVASDLIFFQNFVQFRSNFRRTLDGLSNTIEMA
jgi:hypothetical protein